MLRVTLDRARRGATVLDDPNDGRSEELHVIVFELARIADVVRGCGEVLSSRDQDEVKGLGAALTHAAGELWDLRRRLRALAPSVTTTSD